MIFIQRSGDSMGVTRCFGLYEQQKCEVCLFLQDRKCLLFLPEEHKKHFLYIYYKTY